MLNYRLEDKKETKMPKYLIGDIMINKNPAPKFGQEIFVVEATVATPLMTDTYSVPYIVLKKIKGICADDVDFHDGMMSTPIYFKGKLEPIQISKRALFSREGIDSFVCDELKTKWIEEQP
jgi:hypothetical protein